VFVVAHQLLFVFVVVVFVVVCFFLTIGLTTSSLGKTG
jgi:hypothetical protein